MKKILTLLLAGLLCFSLVACGGGEDNDTPTEETTTETTTEATTEPKKLSEDCDAVLKEGISDNGDTYELVANETENYTGTEIKIGVIKNNEWLIKPTKQCPFLNENGFIFYNYSVYKYLEAVRYGSVNGIKYIGNGCFYYAYSLDYKYYEVIWNTNTNKSYTTTKGSIVLYDGFINDEGKFIFYSQSSGYAIMLDTNTMTETKLKDPISLAASNSKGGIIRYMPYSEGLYCIASYEYIKTGSSWNSPYWDEGISGFYDLEGNLIIDMSEYTIIENDDFDRKNFNNFSFKDGKCSIKVKNDQGSYYKITIDKTGEVLDSYKIG